MQISSRAILIALLALGLATACKKQDSEAPAAAAPEQPAATESTDPNAPGKTTTFEEPKPADQTTAPNQ
jgi:hypothetical protein